MQALLDKPVPVIFAVCQGVQQLVNGAFNLLGIFDKMSVFRLPDGTAPDAVTIQVVTVWTGGRGDFEQVIRVRDQDATQVAEARTPFSLLVTSARHYIINLINIPAREAIYALTVARADEEELLRQDFTIVIAPFPGTDR